LKLKVGLEISTCTGNAQRVTLWDSLRLSHAKVNGQAASIFQTGETLCKHDIEDKDCIHSC
jgi:hypothetical protein